MHDGMHEKELSVLNAVKDRVMLLVQVENRNTVCGLSIAFLKNLLHPCNSSLS